MHSNNSLCGNSCNEVISNLEDKYPRRIVLLVNGALGVMFRECGGGTQTRPRN